VLSYDDAITGTFVITVRGSLRGTISYTIGDSHSMQSFD
jgi:hypothetical protein